MGSAALFIKSAPLYKKRQPETDGSFGTFSRKAKWYPSISIGKSYGRNFTDQRDAALGGVLLSGSQHEATSDRRNQSEHAEGQRVIADQAVQPGEHRGADEDPGKCDDQYRAGRRADQALWRQSGNFRHGDTIPANGAKTEYRQQSVHDQAFRPRRQLRGHQRGGCAEYGDREQDSITIRNFIGKPAPPKPARDAGNL